MDQVTPCTMLGQHKIAPGALLHQVPFLVKMPLRAHNIPPHAQSMDQVIRVTKVKATMTPAMQQRMAALPANSRRPLQLCSSSRHFDSVTADSASHMRAFESSTLFHDAHTDHGLMQHG